VSYATPPMPAAQLTGLTCATVTPEQWQASRRSWNSTDVASSAVVLALIVAAYLYFNG
jgi:SSS family solute:Na+ symporter